MDQYEPGLGTSALPSGLLAVVCTEQPDPSTGEDPLNSWQSRAPVYPNLYKLARRELHMPATCAPGERLF